MIKKYLTIAVVVAILIVVASVAIVFIGGKYSSPERTLLTLVKAMEAGDVDAYLECFTEESQEMLSSYGTQLTSESIKADVSDYKEPDFEVTEKTKDIAVLTEEDGGMLCFKKEKSGWKIDLEETLKRAFQNFPTN